MDQNGGGMKCISLLFKARPIFYLRRGHWGEGGWVKVNWFNWFHHHQDYTNKVRWIKKKRN